VGENIGDHGLDRSDWLKPQIWIKRNETDDAGAQAASSRGEERPTTLLLIEKNGATISPYAAAMANIKATISLVPINDAAWKSAEK
jgi:hypothetical protein